MLRVQRVQAPHRTVDQVGILAPPSARQRVLRLHVVPRADLGFGAWGFRVLGSRVVA